MGSNWSDLSGNDYLWSSNNGIGAMIGMVLVFFGMLHVKIERVEERLDKFTNDSGTGDSTDR